MDRELCAPRSPLHAAFVRPSAFIFLPLYLKQSTCSAPSSKCTKPSCPTSLPGIIIIIISGGRPAASHLCHPFFFSSDLFQLLFFTFLFLTKLSRIFLWLILSYSQHILFLSMCADYRSKNVLSLSFALIFFSCPVPPLPSGTPKRALCCTGLRNSSFFVFRIFSASIG